MTKSWAPEVFLEGKWSRNALRFATEKEAADNAFALLMRWFVPTDSRAAPADEEPNYTWIDGKLGPIGEAV